MTTRGVMHIQSGGGVPLSSPGVGGTTVLSGGYPCDRGTPSYRLDWGAHIPLATDLTEATPGKDQGPGTSLLLETTHCEIQLCQWRPTSNKSDEGVVDDLDT